MKRVFVPSFFPFSLPLIFTLVAASIPHLLTAAIKFSCFSSSEIRSILFIISRSSSFSVIHVGVRIKIWSKKRLGFVAVSSFTPVYIKGWTYARTILSEEKFIGCIDNQIFLPTVQTITVQVSLEVPVVTMACGMSARPLWTRIWFPTST